MARLFSPIIQGVNINGDVRPGQKLTTLSAGTTLSRVAYTDNGLTIPHANPIIADSEGKFPEIYLDEFGYKLRFTDANDVLLEEIDNVFGVPDQPGGVQTNQDVFTATASQQIFTLVNGTYTPGNNNLMVFVNGVLQYEPTNYTETSSTVFTFVTGLEAGDIVVALTNVQVTTNLVFVVSDGTEAVPSISFASDTNTGLYLEAADTLGITTGGAKKVLIDTASISVQQFELRFEETTGGNYVGFVAPGTIAGNVIWTLPDADSTGTQALVSDGAGTLSWSGFVSNPLTADLNAATFDLLLKDGSAADPGLTFISDTDLGVYRVAADTLGFATAATERLRIGSNGVLSVQGTTNYETLLLADDDIINKKYVDDAVFSGIVFPIKATDGSAGAPSYTFLNETGFDSGMYRIGENIVGFSTSGTERLRLEADGTLSVQGTATYEALVTSDDDVPNKRYVDSGGQGVAGAAIKIYAFENLG